MAPIPPIRRIFRLPFRSDDDVAAAVDEELEFHLKMAVDELVQSGSSQAEARAEALSRFGDLEYTRTYCRTVSGRREREDRLNKIVANLGQDIGYAWRTIRANASFSAVVIATLALGIAANTLIFSLMTPYLLRALPFGNAEELVQVGQVDPISGWDQARFSMPQFEDWQERTRAFQEVAAYHYGVGNVTGPEGPEQIQYSVMTANMFSVLQVDPQLGRRFSSDEDGPAGAPVTILGHGLWQRRYAGDPSILGRTIGVDGVQHTVIGIMKPEFNFPFGGVKLWMPLRADPATEARDRTAHIMVGRLNPGWSQERARQELIGIQEELGRTYPDTDGRFSGVSVLPLRQALNFAWDVVRISSVVLISAVIFVLLIACVNVASLSMARAGARSREIAVRSALGAGRSRIVQQLMTESVLLALLGGGLGVLVALLGVRALGSALPEDLYRVGEASIDASVLGFTLAVTLLTPIVFGLTPAIAASRTQLTDALKEGGRGSSGGRSLRGRQGLVILEVAMAIVLITGAGLMIRSFLQLQRVDLGFEPDPLLTVELVPPATEYPGGPDLENFYARVERELEGIPGVRAVGNVAPLPLNHETPITQFTRPARAGTPAESWPTAIPTRVSPGYFAAMGIGVVAGRTFSQADDRDNPPVVLINRTLAFGHFGDGDPIGETLLMGDPTDPTTATIVGVVEDVKHGGIEGDAGPQIYHAILRSSARRRHVVVQVDGPPSSVAAPVRQALAGIDADLPVTLRPMNEIVLENTLQWSVPSILLGAFGLVALVLAALGIYGVISYSVTQRRREIGVRMALGASGKEVRRVVVGEGLRLTGLGFAVGLLATLVLAKLIAALLFGVSPLDPITIGGVLLVFGGVSVAASLFPALRASRTDPLTVLRSD